jgi:hypothetical protein
VSEHQTVAGLEAMARNEDPGAAPPVGGQAALYAALAAAQGQFPAIPRDKTVRVKTRDGGTYSFSYSPLDTILDAVRPVLAANGLAVTQTFSPSGLVTTLMHRGGGIVDSVIPLERSGGSWQEFGSAITYCRRYALIAILGVASEEDDDANAAAGNTVQESKQKNDAAKPATSKQVDEFLAAVRAAGFNAEVARAALVKDSAGEPILQLVLARHRKDLDAVVAAQETDPP